MEKYLEKKDRKYVIATITKPTMYLKKELGKCEYSFVEDISIATKAMKEIVMEQVLNYFRIDTGLDTDLIIVPIDITYEIIEETSYEKSSLN